MAANDVRPRKLSQNFLPVLFNEGILQKGRKLNSEECRGIDFLPGPQLEPPVQNVPKQDEHVSSASRKAVSWPVNELTLGIRLLLHVEL
jgi:hypothetical protein